MADTILYPDFLPLDDAKEVIRIFKGGTAILERSALTKHVWVIQGFVQGKLLGDPDNLKLFSVQSASFATTAVDPIDILEDMVAQEEARRSGMPTAQALPAPFVLLLQWAINKLVELLIAELGINISL